MTLQLLANGLLIIAAVGWIVYRQLTWRPADVPRMFRLAVILGAVGVLTLGSMTKVQLLSSVDIAVLLIELTVAVGVGAIMGAIAVLRPMTDEAQRAYESRPRRRNRGVPQAPVTMETRTGWFGLTLWVVLIAVRIGIDVLAGLAGSHLAASTGVILIVIAANRAARAAVIGYRLTRMPAVLAH